MMAFLLLLVAAFGGWAIGAWHGYHRGYRRGEVYAIRTVADILDPEGAKQ